MPRPVRKANRGFLQVLEFVATACSLKPKDGTKFGLSIDIFRKTSSNSASPDDADGDEHSDDKKEEQKVPPTVIIGMVLGVSALFGLAAAMFIIHFRSERKFYQESKERRYSRLLAARLDRELRAAPPPEPPWDPKWRPRDLFDNDK